MGPGRLPSEREIIPGEYVMNLYIGTKVVNAEPMMINGIPAPTWIRNR